MILFSCVAGLVQPVEDRPGDGQDDDAQQRVCVSAAGHGERRTDRQREEKFVFAFVSLCLSGPDRQESSLKVAAFIVLVPVPVPVPVPEPEPEPDPHCHFILDRSDFNSDTLIHLANLQEKLFF